MSLPGRRTERDHVSSSECSECGAEFVVGMQFVQKHPLTKQWIMWRLCKACAKRNGDLE